MFWRFFGWDWGTHAILQQNHPFVWLWFWIEKVGIGSDPRPPPWDKIPTFTENFWNRHQDIRQTWNRTDTSRVDLKQDKLRKDRWRKSLNHMQVPTVLPSSLVTLYYRLPPSRKTFTKFTRNWSNKSILIKPDNSYLLLDSFPVFRGWSTDYFLDKEDTSRDVVFKTIPWSVADKGRRQQKIHHMVITRSQLE